MIKEDCTTLSPQMRLLILASRLTLAPGERQDMADLIRAGIDWEELQRDSFRLGVSPLLSRHLSCGECVSLVPESVIRNLERGYRWQSIKNLRICGQMRQLLEACHAQGIAIVQLKGSFLIGSVYKDIGLRPLSDIDILCRERDTDRLVGILESLNYWKKQDFPSQSLLHERFCRNKSHLPPFIRPAGVHVEVHNDIFLTSAAPTAVDRIWDSIFPLERDGLKRCFLPPEYQLLCLCDHLYKHILSGSVVFYWFCDIHEIIPFYGGKINWQRFRSLAQEHGLGQQAGAVLSLLRTYWKTPLPSDVLDISQQFAVDFTSLVESSLSQRRQDTFLLPTCISRLKRVAREEGWWKGVCFLTRYFFPVKAHIVGRYQPQHPIMVYLYYAVHAIRIGKKAVMGVVHYLRWLLNGMN